MKPIYQTIRDPGKGNCWAACIASLVEANIDDVPNFILDPDWFKATQEWLAERGWGLIQLKWPEEIYDWQWPNCLVIMSGRGPRGVRHSVICRLQMRNESGYAETHLVHDPYPGGSGLLKQTDDQYISFVFRLTK